MRKNAVSCDDPRFLRASGVVLSPGAGAPGQSGVCLEIVARALSGELGRRLFGVCLGHQAIGHCSGMVVRRAAQPRHGKVSWVDHDGRGVFLGVPGPCAVVRYYSLVIDPETLHPDFDITARALDDGEIMGVRHRALPIEGVQFHPESILIEHGLRMIQNVLDGFRAAEGTR